MATGEKILHSDIIEPGNPFAAVEKGIDQLLVKFTTLTGQLKQNGTGLKQLQSQEQKNKQSTDEVLKLKQKELQLREKLIASATVEAQSVAQLTEKVRVSNNENRNLAKTELALAGSMNQISAQLAVNKQRYAALSAEQRKNKQLGGELLKTIKQQDKEIKKLSGTMGDHQRNVGNYGSAITGAAGSFGLMGGAMMKVQAGLQILKVGFTTLKGAIMSTGIGALVIAIVSLVQWFKETASGASKLRELMIPLKAIFETFTNVIKNVGEGIFKIFSGDVRDGIDQITGSVKNLNAEYKRQLDLQTQIAVLRDITEKKYYEDTIRLAQLERDIAAARLIANDEENNSLQEQITAIEKAAELTKEYYQIKQDAAQRAVAAIVLESEASENSEEANRALADAIAAVVKVDAERDTALKALTRRSTTLYNKQRTDIKEVTFAVIEQIDIFKEKGQTFEEMMRDDIDLIEKELQVFLDAEDAKQEAIKITQQIEDQVRASKLMAINEAFNLAQTLFEKETIEAKILGSAQAAINTAVAATKALTLPPPANWFQFAAVIAAGLAQVASINNVKFADGTDYVDDRKSPQGRDTIPAWLDRGEMVLTRDEAAMVRNMGLGHSDVPGMAYVGMKHITEAPRLTAVAMAQLSEQRNTNSLLRKWKIIKPDGTEVNLNGDEIKHYIN